MPSRLPIAARRLKPRGFTLVEMLTVVAVVGILIGMLFPILAESRRRARMEECKSQMGQIHKAMQMWKDDKGRYSELKLPGRLNYLYFEKYVPDRRIFVCPSDRSQGKEGGKPDAVSDQFSETDEGPGINGLPSEAGYSSYLYEFNEAPCSWFADTSAVNANGDTILVDLDEDGTTSWQEAKWYQLAWGDDWHWEEYPQTHFPVVRCFWHEKDPDNETLRKEVLNMSLSGNVYQSGPEWELVAVEILEGE